MRAEGAAQVRAKLAERMPQLAGAEPVARYAGLRPAGRGRELRDRPLRARARGSSTSRRSARPGLTAALGIAEQLCGARRASRGASSAPERAAPSPGRPRPGSARTARGGGAPRGSGGRAAHERAPDPRHRRGHDRREGGALRRATCGRCASARREQSASPSRSRAGSSRIRDEILGAVVDAVARAARATLRARSSPAASTTRASRSSPGTPRPATPLTPVVVWQDKRSQDGARRLSDGDAAEIRRRSGLPLDPYFSAGKLAWLLRA